MNTGHNQAHSELVSYETVIPMKVSIPAKCCCFMAAGFCKADIHSSKTNLIFGAQIVLEKVA
jgi:hypothetical protein